MLDVELVVTVVDENPRSDDTLVPGVVMIEFVEDVAVDAELIVLEVDSNV